MLGFLRENWVWIAAPIALLILLALAVLTWVGVDEVSPFSYPIR